MGINVLSLFDGMSCGMIALKRLGIYVDNYYASEIDKYAMEVSKNNHPEIVQMGDVKNWRDWRDRDIDFSKIDLLLAGFPCQAWSTAGKQKGDNDPRGALVYDLLDIFNEVKKFNPDVKFLFENVRMKKDFLEFMNNLFGCEPIMINSSLVSAQNRQRFYWTNICGVTQPEDKGILLKDIVHEVADLDSALSEGWCRWFKGKADFQISKKYSSLDPDKAITMTARQYANWNGNFIFECLSEYIVPFDKTLKILEKEVERGKVGYFRKDSQANRVYYIHDKSVTLCGENSDAGGGAAKMGQYLFGCITPDRVNKRQNGQRFNDGRKFYTLTAQDRHGVLIEGYIRKLTPVECERLQTVEDGYTEGVSNTQRYKMLGNGWTVDVICHILKNLK